MSKIGIRPSLGLPTNVDLDFIPKLKSALDSSLGILPIDIAGQCSYSVSLNLNWDDFLPRLKNILYGKFGFFGFDLIIFFMLMNVAGLNHLKIEVFKFLLWWLQNFETLM